MNSVMENEPCYRSWSKQKHSDLETMKPMNFFDSKIIVHLIFCLIRQNTRKWEMVEWTVYMSMRANVRNTKHAQPSKCWT